nr:hypothetical protein [Bacteroides sp.]
MRKQYTLFMVMLLGLFGFSMTAGDIIFTVEGTGDACYWFDSEAPTTVTPGNPVTIPFKAGQLYISAPDGSKVTSVKHLAYGYETVVNEMSTQPGTYNFSLRSNHSRYTWDFVITTESDGGTVEPEPEGNNFFVEEGDVYLWNWRKWELVKKLDQGDNLFTDLDASGTYAIVGNGVINASDLTVTNANGENIPVSTSAMDFDGVAKGYYATVMGSSLSSKYTIKAVAAPEPEPWTTVVNVGAGVKVTGWYQNMSTYAWVEVPMTEGANNISIPNDTYEFRIALDGSIAPEDVTCESNTGAQVGCVNKPVQGYNCFVLTPSEFAASYTVALKPKSTNFTINIDKAANAQVINTTGNGFKVLSLQDGANEFSADEVTSFQVNSQTGGDFYKFLVDGVEVEPTWNSYTVNPTAAGMVIDILTEFPDQDLTYTIVYKGTPNVWAKVTTGDPYTPDSQVEVPVTNNTFTVKLGQNVNLFADNASELTVNSVTVPGKAFGPNDWMPFPGLPNINFQALEAGEIVTDIKGKEYYDLTINIEGNPDLVTVTYGDPNSYRMFTELTGLKEGANTLEKLNEGWAVRVATKGNTEITSLTYKASADSELKNASFDATSNDYFVGPFTGQGCEVNITILEKDPDYYYMTLNVEGNPEDLVIYTDYSYYNPERNRVLECELKEGQNTVAVPQTTASQFGYVQLWFGPASFESKVERVHYLGPDGKEYNGISETGGTFSINIQDNYVVDVTVSHTDYDGECTVFTDLGGNFPIKLVNAAGRSESLTSGYNTFHFQTEAPEYEVECDRSVTVFVNGEEIEGKKVSLADGDLVKIYAGSTDALTVSIKLRALKDECEDVKVVDVMTDGRDAVEDFEESIEVLPGTQVSFAISAPEDVTYSVRTADESLTADDNGVYTIWPTANYDIQVIYTYEDPNKDGIDTITRDDLDMTATYFDLTGRRIDASAVTTGLYIKVAGNVATKIAVK